MQKPRDSRETMFLGDVRRKGLERLRHRHNVVGKRQSRIWGRSLNRKDL